MCTKKVNPESFARIFGQNLGKKNRAFSFYQARLPRIERGTYGLEGRCSIQLSYRRVLYYTRSPLSFSTGMALERGKTKEWSVRADHDFCPVLCSPKRG